MYKLAILGIVTVLLAAAQGSAAIITGDGTFVLLGSEGSDAQTWGIDGTSMTVELVLEGQGAVGDSAGWWDAQAAAQVMLKDDSGFLEIAVTPGGTIEIFTSGSELSDAVGGLAFSSNLFGQDIGSGGSTDMTEAGNMALANATAGAMGEVISGASGNGIMAFRYASGGGFNYGWANLVWDSSNGSFFLGIDNVTASNSQGILAGTTTEVPEPTTAALLLGGLATILSRRRPRRR